MVKDKKPARHKKKPPHRGGGRAGKPPQKHSSHLPETCVVMVTSVSEDGELLAAPIAWDPKKKPPHIVVTESGRGKAAVVGDKLLVKLRRIEQHLYQGLVIRLLPTDAPEVIYDIAWNESKKGHGRIRQYPQIRQIPSYVSVIILREATGRAERQPF